MILSAPVYATFNSLATAGEHRKKKHILKQIPLSRVGFQLLLHEMEFNVTKLSPYFPAINMAFN